MKIPKIIHSESKRRCLVLGSSGYSGIESVEWDADELPNIVDFDTVVVDVRSLDEKKLSSVTDERLTILRHQLTRLLDSNGQIIVVSDFLKSHKRTGKSSNSVDNYDWCPIRIALSKESGKSIEILESKFSGYIKHLKRWPYYFYIPNGSLSKELTRFYGLHPEAMYLIPGIPFVKNRYSKTIAGTYQIEVTIGSRHRGTSSYTYPDKPSHVTGDIIVLPLIEKLDHKEAVSLVLEDLTGISMSYTPPPWVDSIDVPHVLEIEKEIKDNEKQKDAISLEIDKLQSRRESMCDFRKLIYSSGLDLQEIVKRCFEDLGAKVTPAKYGEEEYIVEYEGIEYLVEVKGVSKSISLGHLRQLHDYLSSFEEDTGMSCKGILFGNAWRTFPLEERNTKDKLEFPDNVVARAEKWEVALVSSTKFFKSYCQFLNGKADGHVILKDILDGAGIIEFT